LINRHGAGNKFEFIFVTTKKKETQRTATRARPLSATAAAILGHATAKNHAADKPKKIKAEWQKYYNHLLELREQLLHQMNGLAKESAQEMPGYSLHMADSGTDNFDRDFALSLLSADQDAIYEIEEAIKRIEKRTYGVCELTGKPIPRARLEAIPWTRFTVAAQAQLEKDGALKSRRLGQLGTIDNAGATEMEGEDIEESNEEPKAAKEKEE
jgi:RNA polymerase-binding transcription factor DksA